MKKGSNKLENGLREGVAIPAKKSNSREKLQGGEGKTTLGPAEYAKENIPI